MHALPLVLADEDFKEEAVLLIPEREKTLSTCRVVVFL